jgi:hypothetical protein
VAESGLTLKTSTTKDTLKAYPVENLTPELAAALKDHKVEIIRILREDEEFRRTGILQSERQVFGLTREHFGLNQEGGTV